MVDLADVAVGQPHVAAHNDERHTINTAVTELASHDTELTSHTASIASHTTELAVHTTELASHATSLGTLDTRITTAQAEIDGEITDSIDAQATTINAQGVTIAAHTTELATHAGDIAAHATAITSHGTRLTTAETTIIADGVELGLHTGELAEHDASINAHSTTINAQGVTIAAHTTELATHQTYIDAHPSLSGGSSLQAWAGLTAYNYGHFVTQGGYVYISTIQHVSTASFTTDLAASKWFQAGVDPAAIGAVELAYTENKTNRSVTDVVLTSGSANISSATANFGQGDVGRIISSASGITVGTKILSVTDATHAVMTANATANVNPATVTIGDFPFATAVVRIPGVTLVIPASVKPVYIKTVFTFIPTTTSTGVVYCVEVANGTDTPITKERISNVVANNVNNVDFEWRLGTTARTRTFYPAIQVSAGTGNVNVPNDTTLPWDLYMRAVGL